MLLQETFKSEPPVESNNRQSKMSLDTSDTDNNPDTLTSHEDGKHGNGRESNGSNDEVNEEASGERDGSNGDMSERSVINRSRSGSVDGRQSDQEERGRSRTRSDGKPPASRPGVQRRSPVERISRSRSRERRHGSSSKRSRRSRSRSGRSKRSRRHRSSSRSRRDNRRRSVSREERRFRSYDREHRRERELSPRREPKRDMSPDPAERDRRTVFCSQLAARLKTRDLESFLKQCGRIRDAKIVMDKVTGRSKGVAYVEFYDEASVAKAIALSGEKLLGIPIIIELSEAEKNRLAEQAAFALKQHSDHHGETGSYSNRLYVGSLHYSLTEENIRSVFEPFGPIEFVNLHMDLETGRSKGFAFVQFKHVKHALQAMEKLNGFELIGRQIKVGNITDRGSHAANIGNSQQRVGGFNLDDSEVEGVALNSLSRVELMAKLAREDVKKPEAAPVVPVVNAPAVVVPRMETKCVLLKNMFNAAEETEPDWVTEIKEDVQSECSKYGPVTHIVVEPDTEGHVYLKFATLNGAQAAINALNGRFFAGKSISAVFVSETLYCMQYPEASSL